MKLGFAYDWVPLREAARGAQRVLVLADDRRGNRPQARRGHPRPVPRGEPPLGRPGRVSDETCGAFHWASVKYPARDMVGVRDNPMIAIIDEVARRAGLRYIVNTVLDARNRIVRVVAGDPVAAHREGCRGRAVSRRGRRDPLIRARRPAAGGRREVSPPFSPWERQLSVLSAERRA